MTRPPWLIQSAIAATLALLLAAEFVLSASPPSAPATLVVPAGTPAPAGGDIGQWASTILARPLFNASRRPIQQAVTDIDTTLPRLSAIIVSGGVRSAVFDQGGEKPLVLTAGGEIGAYRLESIAPDNVDLLGPGGQITLRPQFATTAPALPGN
jgi:hypothetical protein